MAQDSEIFAPLVVYFGRCQGKCPREHTIIAFHVRLKDLWRDVSGQQPGCKTGEDTGLHPAPVLVFVWLG